MAIIGWDTSVEINDGISNAYVLVPDCMTISVPATEKQMVEITSLQSANRVRQYMVAMTEPGEFSFTVQHVGTVYNRLYNLLGEAKNFKVEWSNGDEVVVPGFITKIEEEISAPGDLVVDKVSVKVNGIVVFTAAV